MEVRIIKATTPDLKKWKTIMNDLATAGFRVTTRPQKADLSIVLGGRFENPLAFKGYRVLAYNPGHWPPPVRNAGFAFFKPLLEEYYDELLEVNSNNAVEVITEYVRRKRQTN